MRTGGPNEADDLPPGYELVRFDSFTSVALPSETARASRKELTRRAEAQDEARREEQRQRLETAKEESLVQGRERDAKARAETDGRRTAFDDEPAPGHYRVIRKWAELLNATEDSSAALRSADKDVNERVAKLRERLIHNGPDRRIARPEGWRQSMDQLEAALPHFAEPIRLLRNSLALADATRRPVRVPPMLLLGPPGVGKTHFTHRVAELMGAPHASVAFDQPTAGSTLRGSDAYWSNSSTGLLFNLICMGECANPVVLLDELDKSFSASSRHEIDPLAQLHGALEPETSQCTVDISVDIEFDASQVTYIATANSLRGVSSAILSRIEVFRIEPPEVSESVEIARAIVNQVLKRMNLQDTLGFDHKGLYVLAHLSPRLMLRTTEKAVAAAVAAGQTQLSESDLWAELGPDVDGPRPH